MGRQFPSSEGNGTFGNSGEYIYCALRADAVGFMLKDVPSTRLIAAVHAAATGDSLIEPSIPQRPVERVAEPTPAAGLPEELAGLTERERDVLRLVARGLSPTPRSPPSWSWPRRP